MAKDDRPKIPEPIKREVRQRCGFGCVKCGFPFYEYHHMIGWAKEHRHIADEITLLCDQHHSEVTKGLLTEEQVIKANNNPYNKKTGVNKPYTFNYEGSGGIVMQLGSFTVTHTSIQEGMTLSAVTVFGKSQLFFRLLDGQLFLNLKHIDPETQNKIAIIDNELVYSSNFWDIQLVGRRLTIRTGRREILLDVQFNIPDTLIIKHWRMLHGNIEVLIREGGVFMRDIVTGDSHAIHNSLMRATDLHTHAIVVGDAPTNLGEFNF